MEGDVTPQAEFGVMHFGEEGATSQRMRVASRSWKGKDMVSPLKSPEGPSSSDTLTLAW